MTAFPRTGTAQTLPADAALPRRLKEHRKFPRNDLFRRLADWHCDKCFLINGMRPAAMSEDDNNGR
jgi:hypothetical protein